VRTRLGLGPVFAYEWLIATRRWQLYASRAVFVLAILAGMVFISEMIWRNSPAGGTTTLEEMASYGQSLYLTIVSIELAVVLLVAPAATAGAICLDKARGTLDHMLATDLSNAEIVLGKLGVRLAPVLGLIACVLPIMALSGLMGGIDPVALFGSLLVAVGCAVLSCSLALTLSVWGRKTQDVLTLTYLMIILWLFSRYLLGTVLHLGAVSSAAFLIGYLWDWLEFLNPYYVVWAPYSNLRNVTPARYFGFLSACLASSACLAAVATCRIRAVARAQGGRGPIKRRRFSLAIRLPKPAWLKSLPGPTLDGNPVFWREWHRAKPSPIMRLVWIVYSGLGIVWVIVAIQNIASPSPNREMIAIMNVFQVAVGLLLLSVNASTSLAEERVRGSLDILLATPLSTQSILAGKWAGIFGSVPKLLFAPVVTTMFVAFDSGLWVPFFLFVGLMLAYSAVIVSLGLALATWQSRLGRAVALNVAFYVVFSFGWPALVIATSIGGGNDHLILPALMGTPLYGTALATLMVAGGPYKGPGSPTDLWIGCCVWTIYHSAAAALLYRATVATFDRCLGRMPDSDRPASARSDLQLASFRRKAIVEHWNTVPCVALLVLASLGADGDRGPMNLNLEDGKPGEVPTGWFLPGPSREAGFRAIVTEEQAKEGRRCALLTREGARKAGGFGNLMQAFAAAPYREKRIRIRAAVRTEGSERGARAQLWVRVDRKGGVPGFFDNMGDRPIRESKWRDYEIVGDVAKDAESIAMGLMLLGDGKAWLDAVTVESIGKTGEGNEPPRPLKKRGLENLVALARLLGYVRYFHPSDEAAATDWNTFAIDGVRAAENARDPIELKNVLEQLLRPIAPSVRIFLTGEPAPAALGDANPDEAKPAARVLVWRHVGVGLGQSPIYSSTRIDLRKPEALGESKPPHPELLSPDRPLVVELGGGCSAAVPLAVFADETKTLPAPGGAGKSAKTAEMPAGARPRGINPSGNDRATRLADVILAWNVFQHFYPYFDVAGANWPAELAQALSRAAVDVDDRAFLETLRRLVAAAHDGHGGVYGAVAANTAFPPFGWDWVEGQLVITGVAAQEHDDLKPGDRVVEIDGRPVTAALADVESMISGATPQWRRFRALIELASGAGDSQMVLKVQGEAVKTEQNLPAEPAVRTVRVRRSLERHAFEELREPRPAKIATVKPGVIYVDLSRITQPEFDEIVPQLADARGIVFDLRGYPQGIAVQTIGHLTDVPVTCAQWHVPVAYFPDRRDVTYRFSNWSVKPAAPRFRAKVAFLTDGRAISYAETYLAIIEHYKLAEIVGSPTAGTNGNVNPFTLPGGYRVAWTGMKVLKHDGSRHHGVGIQPTIPAGRTMHGIATGHDELLDRAVAVVSPAK
jgi:C-terminal processing protease CtpA/Prc/ABC-type transport system involved in multi-copper enzyme maturation permease subunit